MAEKRDGAGSHPAKWVIVTGGVLSGLGKGIVTSSIGALLRMRGFRVSATKIDPYVNVDAGTMRPTEHGEVFVTFDGGETDQDLGNYERFIGCKLSRYHNITTGQVFQEVIRRERNLEYGGRNVEIMRDIPAEVIRRLQENARQSDADVMLVEIGGTVGDYENVLFLEAVRLMKQRGYPMVFVHVSYLPVLSNVGEMKTKPTQHSVRALRENGIFPDFIVARGRFPLDAPRREKISVLCHVSPDAIVSAPDVDSIYEVPLLFHEQSFDEKILSVLGVSSPPPLVLDEWESFVTRGKNASREVRVGVVGKYFDTGDFTLEDSYISVIEALKAAGVAHDAKVRVVWVDAKEFERDPSAVASLREMDAVVVPGGFGASGVEGKIRAIRFCREEKIPFLGLCYGMQLAVVEWARHVIGLEGAHTTEIDPDTPHPVITILPEQKELLERKEYGNSMRLGEYPAILVKGSLVHSLYGVDKVFERHRHRYEVNPEYVETLEQQGLVFSGRSPDKHLMEFLEVVDHPFFVATQAHPEFSSSPLRPHPLFRGLIRAALDRHNP